MVISFKVLTIEDTTIEDTQTELIAGEFMFKNKMCKLTNEDLFGIFIVIFIATAICLNI